MEQELGIDNLFTGYDLENLFEQQEETTPEEIKNELPQEEEHNNTEEETTEVDPGTLFEGLSESVGSEENNESGGNQSEQEPTTSPDDFYSSIAKACKDDDVLPELEESDIEACKSSGDFADLLNKVVDQRVDERTKRVEAALTAGLTPQQVNNYEKILQDFDSISEEQLTEEGDNGDNLRKQLMLLDYKNKGFSEKKAMRLIEQSFEAGTEVDDAREALANNKEFYQEKYDEVIKEGKEFKKKQQEKIKTQSEALKKSILEDNNLFGEVDVDSRTRQKVYDTISRPKYKDENGNMMTELQKYQKENPTEFLKYFGLFYTMTDGFKDFDKLVKGKVTKEVKKNLESLEKKINTTSRNSSGQLTFVNNKDAESVFRNFRIDI